MKINKVDLERVIHEVDLYMRNAILFVNPSQEEQFKQVLKGTELEDKVIVQPSSYVEVDKAYLMDRKQLEDWGAPEVKFDFGKDIPWENNTWSELE